MIGVIGGGVIRSLKIGGMIRSLRSGASSFGFGIKNSVSFFGDGCGVIIPGIDLGCSITLVDIVVISLVDSTGCFEENITAGEISSFIEGGGVMSLFFPCFAASNASKSFCDVNVVTLLSIGVVGGVSSCG